MIAIVKDIFILVYSRSDHAKLVKWPLEMTKVLYTEMHSVNHVESLKVDIEVIIDLETMILPTQIEN